LRLLNAAGDFVDCSATCEPDLFKAAQVSLGALGIVTRVTLQLLPAYRLHERSWTLPFENCMAQLDRLIEDNRHVEFFWLPSEDICAIKTLNPSQLEYLPQKAHRPQVSQAAARYVQPERLDWSYRIFPSVRERKFNEQEFAIAAENGPACLREIRQLMRSKHPTVTWPLEYRRVAADDIPLSPFYRRDGVTISVHQAADLPCEAFFRDTEAIFRNYQGRPHWGKMHDHSATELSQLYPAWDEFLKVRKQLDPQGRFLNPYLKRLFALTS
jgi:FAD/FMN-containing dehydrogenase